MDDMVDAGYADFAGILSGLAMRSRNRLIQEAMQTLPEIYRGVVTLKIWAGLTFSEIADVLEIPANTAASRYRYGLEELRVDLISCPGSCFRFVCATREFHHS